MLVTAVAMIMSVPQATAAPPARSQQELFNAASTAAVSGKCDEALRLFAQLEAAQREPKPAVAATITVRKASCLAQQERVEEITATLPAAVELLDQSGANYAEDAAAGHLFLARMAYRTLDFASAERHARRFLDSATGVDRAPALIMLAFITMFDGDGKALVHTDELLAILAQTGATDKASLAAAHTARGRVLLNLDRYPEAYAELRKAIDLQGGLGTNVKLADVITRSDAAIAAMLAKRPDDARKYLVYTGAGRMKDAPFATALSMKTPACGEAGLQPEDHAVVEFELNADGTIAKALPIYASTGREGAIEFARAVSSWAWTPEKASAIPAFFRYATRVELRCSQADTRPGLMDALVDRFFAWVGGKELWMDREQLPQRRREAAQAALASATGRQRLGLLVALADHPLVGRPEKTAYAGEAGRLADELKAPAEGRLLIGLARINAGLDEDYRKRARQYPVLLRGLLQDPLIAADPRAGSTLKVMIARPGYLVRTAPDADQLIDGVIADTRLPADDPVRIAALLEKANREAAAGRLESARQAFGATGLTEQQCAVAAPEPALRRSAGNASDYPIAAVQWGFEGWTRIEFDILTDGRTATQRAVIAHPPFVFNNAGTGIARDLRYQATYRPSGGEACSAQQQNIVFQLPG